MKFHQLCCKKLYPKLDKFYISSLYLLTQCFYDLLQEMDEIPEEEERKDLEGEKEDGEKGEKDEKEGETTKKEEDRAKEDEKGKFKHVFSHLILTQIILNLFTSIYFGMA